MFKISYIPVIKQSITDSYIVKFDDLVYLENEYGLNYDESIKILSEVNSLPDNKISIAIQDYDTILNPYIINEFSYDYILIPISKKNIIYRYIDECFSLYEQYNLSEQFLYDSIIDNVYLEEFVNEGTIDNIKTNVNNAINTIKDNINSSSIVQSYKENLPQNTNSPNMRDRIQAAGKAIISNPVSTYQIGDNIGDIIQLTSGNFGIDDIGQNIAVDSAIHAGRYYKAKAYSNLGVGNAQEAKDKIKERAQQKYQESREQISQKLASINSRMQSARQRLSDTNESIRNSARTELENLKNLASQLSRRLNNI